MEFTTRRTMFRQLGALSAAALLGGCVVEERGRPYAAPAPAPVVSEVYVQAPPPPVRYEVRPPPPRAFEEVFWRPGHWIWTGREYSWNPGVWLSRPHRGAEWEPERWVERPGRGWVFVPGHWRG